VVFLGVLGLGPMVWGLGPSGPFGFLLGLLCTSFRGFLVAVSADTAHVPLVTFWGPDFGVQILTKSDQICDFRVFRDFDDFDDFQI